MKFPYFGNKKRSIAILEEGKKKRCYIMREVGGEEVRIESGWIIDTFDWNNNRLPDYLGFDNNLKRWVPKCWEIVGEFVEMPEIIFEKLNHKPYENTERLMQEFEKYGWGNKKQENGIAATIMSKIFSSNYKTPQLYGAK